MANYLIEKFGLNLGNMEEPDPIEQYVTDEKEQTVALAAI